jgi:MFS family permease
VQSPAPIPDGTPRLFWARARSALTGPRLHWFRLLFATRLTGQFADGAFQVALASYVVFSPQNEATAGQVAKAFAVLLLPFTLVGPFAGVFLDRWPRRQVLVWANVLRAVLVLGVAGCVATVHGSALFYVGALAVMSANRFILAGLSASLPHTVAADQLVTANAVSPTAGTLAATCGGAIGLITHALLGSGDRAVIGSLVCVAALYALAALVASTIPRALLGPMTLPEGGAWTALRSVARGVYSGARHVVRRPSAGRALGAIAASRFCYGVVTIMTLLLDRNHFNDPAQPNRGLAGFALAVGLSGVGFGLGAVITPFVTRRLRLESWIAACLIGSAVIELALGSPFRSAPLLAGAVLLGFCAQCQKICTDTLVQRSIDDEFRGRVFVFYDMLFNGAFVLAAAFAAATLPVSGASYLVLGVVAGGYAMAGLWYLLSSRRRNRPLGPNHSTPAAQTTTPTAR